MIWKGPLGSKLKESYCLPISISVTSLVAQMVKCLPTMRETQVWSLGWEDPLEKEMATHSSTLAWKIPWMECGRLSPRGRRVGNDWATSLSFSSIVIFVSCFSGICSTSLLDISVLTTAVSCVLSDSFYFIEKVNMAFLLPLARSRS